MAGKKPPLHETIEKERRVLELRLAQYRWQDIATNVGYASAGAAYNAYKRALVRTLQEPADEVRTQERERLDRMANALYQRAISGDIPAIHTMIKIMDRRAKYLGLDEIKIKQDVTITEGGNEFNERVKELAHLVARNRIDASGLDGGISPLLVGDEQTEPDTSTV